MMIVCTSAVSISSLHGLVLRSMKMILLGACAMVRCGISGANFVPQNANKVSDLDELIDFINTNP
jgi:hypothetical protein